MTSAVTRLVAHDPITTLSANGIVPLAAKLADDQRASPVTARTYAHPALDGKVIVRIEPEAVAAGTDAEMAAFGFDAPKVSRSLGKVRSRTLGFPAWALVHEPKKAKAALDVTEDLRKAKRLVAAKPGHAKDAFEKIAKRLQKSAPQFLPSFWEEVARVVADQASASMAAQCFERARQAERAYKLKIDADDADQAFVEFALLGALSAKTLTTYAKDLTKSAGGVEAFRRFRAIVVKRALGGMPPYSGMGKDLAALAKAANTDEEAEADKLAAELVEAPGVGKAPMEFWTTYRPSLLRLGTQNAELRQRLRVIWPEPRGGSDEAREEFAGGWVDLLDEIGALADIPDDGLGGWVSRLVKFAGDTPKVRAVMRAQAERLARLDQKIQVVAKARWYAELHLDLAEFALELGIPLADPGNDDFSTESMTCDPVRVAAHPEYSKKLVEAVASMIGNANHEHKMRGKAGFAQARRVWLEEHVGGLTGKPFREVQSNLETLEKKTTPEMFLGFADLHERLAATDLASALALQLRGGVADELGWPAYEEAAAALGTPVKTAGAFPLMTVWNATKALAFDATGMIAEHDLVKPKDFRVEEVWYFDGQFLVDLYNDKEYERERYWSAKPKDRFEQKGSFETWNGQVPNQWSPPEGGVTVGGKLFRAGDKELDSSRDFICDGTQMWTQAGRKWLPYDPVKGERAKTGSPPAWFAEFGRDGWSVTGQLQPLPAGLANSPLGVRDGLIGIRSRSKDDDWDDKFKNDHERIDGVAVQSTWNVFGLMTFPGDDRPRAIDTEDANSARFLGGSGAGVEVWSPEHDRLFVANEDEWAARGWGDVLVPPAAFWDYLAPRDPAGSAALRAITDDQARTILTAAIADVVAAGDGSGKQARPMPQTEAAVRAVLPEITDAKLVRGVVGVAERAGELARQVAELADSRAKDKADPGGQGLLGDAALLRKLAGALSSGRQQKIADFDLDPKDYLRFMRARAALSLSPLVDDDQRRKTREMVQAMSGTIFAEDMSHLRYISLEEPDDYDNPYDDTLEILKVDGSIFALHGPNNWALELSTDGKWRVPAPWKLGDEEIKLGKGIGTQWADKFLELPDEAIPWDPAIADKIAERADLSTTEAALLWVNTSQMSTWSKDFLGKKHRETLGGLKVNDVDAAQTTFKELDEDKMLEIYERAVPDDPALLRTPLAPGGFAERLGDAWKAKFGKRAKIPQDLIAAAKKDLDVRNELAKLLPAFAGGADDAKFLVADRRPLHDLGGWGDEHGLTMSESTEAIQMIAWLYLARPIGCPIRAGIPAVVERIRAIALDDTVIWPFDSRWLDEDNKEEIARQQGILEAVGGAPVEFPADDDEPCIGGRDDGTCVVAAYKNRIYAGFRPAKLDGKTRKKVEQLASLMVDREYGDGDDTLARVERIEYLKSDAFATFGERVAETPVAEGGYEANPLQSCPKLVAKIAGECDISEDAAALYLMTLALAEPTQTRVQTWMGWKPKQYKDAAAELVKKKLVTEGKRERAGRTLFLKGGYSKGSGKNLPMEDWKQPFYKRLDRHLPTEPVHLLYARAWKRVEDGDTPGS